MNEVDLQAAIEDELKEMRKGEGLSKFNMQGNSVLAVAFHRNRAVLRGVLEDELHRLQGETNAGALIVALAIGDVVRWPHLMNDDPAKELTLRRRNYADKTGVSERTLSRHEDEAIEKLARRLVIKFRVNAFREAIEADYIPGYKDNSSSSSTGQQRRSSSGGTTSSHHSTSQSSDSHDLPKDIPSLIKRQKYLATDMITSIVEAENDIAALRRDIQTIRNRVSELTEINKRLADAWGVQ